MSNAPQDSDVVELLSEWHIETPIAKSDPRFIPAIIQLLSEGIHQRIQVLEGTQRLFTELATSHQGNEQLRRLVILLDWDVIYSYINGRSDEGSIHGELRYFFEVSNLEYALPQGTMNELLQYLFKGRVLESSTTPLERIQMVVNALDQQTRNPPVVPFYRLLETLTSSRCLGVCYASHESVSARDLIHEIVSLMGLDAEEERQYQGQNIMMDAMNLATALIQTLPQCNEQSQFQPIIIAPLCSNPVPATLPSSVACRLLTLTENVHASGSRLGYNYLLNFYSLTIRIRTITLFDLLGGTTESLARSRAEGNLDILLGCYQRIRAIQGRLRQPIRDSESVFLDEITDSILVPLADSNMSTCEQRINALRTSIAPIRLGKYIHGDSDVGMDTQLRLESWQTQIFFRILERLREITLVYLEHRYDTTSDPVDEGGVVWHHVKAHPINREIRSFFPPLVLHVGVWGAGAANRFQVCWVVTVFVDRFLGQIARHFNISSETVLHVVTRKGDHRVLWGKAIRHCGKSVRIKTFAELGAVATPVFDPGEAEQFTLELWFGRLVFDIQSADRAEPRYLRLYPRDLRTAGTGIVDLYAFSGNLVIHKSVLIKELANIEAAMQGRFADGCPNV